MSASVYAGIIAACTAFEEETGHRLPEIALDPKMYRVLCSELDGKVVARPLGLLPTHVMILDCEVWPR